MVKFSHSLQFNAVPDWASEYISYSTLKKTLYSIEKYNVQTSIQRGTFQDDLDARAFRTGQNTALNSLQQPRQPDLDVEAAGADILPIESAPFSEALAKELAKVTKFYLRKEKELRAEMEAIHRQLELEGIHQGVVSDTQEGLTRRLTVNETDEQKLQSLEKKQLNEKLFVQADGLQDNIGSSTSSDHDTDRHSITNTNTTIGEATDVTKIVWRRECLIESEKETASGEKPSVGNNTSHLTVASEPANRRLSTSSMTSPLHAGTEPRRKSISLSRKSFSMAHDPVYANPEDSPHHRPIAVGPLTTEALLRRRLTDTFVLFSELKSYVALNYLGFQKILKKHDKLALVETLPRYMSMVVDPAVPFRLQSRQQVDAMIKDLQIIYANGCCNGDLAQAAKELRGHLREYIVWERNTIWRDMVGQERKTEGAHAQDKHAEEPWFLFGLEIRHFSKETFRRCVMGFIAIILFIVLMTVPIFATVEENNCFAILVVCAWMWATEVFPLFVTALLVPLLVVLLQVMRDPNTGARLSAEAATTAIFGYMFSPTVMLLLGGFTIASALSKFGIAKKIATNVLSKAGTDPKWVLLANMIVATVASCFISNVAAPVLCFTLLQPILKALPHNSSFAPCLILGIALASDIGGMASPISSPQNILTVQNMSPTPSWGVWFAVSIPVCLICDLIIWAWLLMYYRPSRDTPSIPVIRPVKEKITRSQVIVGLVTIATIVLWCIENTLKDELGDMGIVAILPMIAFFGFGFLTKDDFNDFLWNIIVLAMGGIALGKAVQSSGLLDTIAHDIQNAIGGFSIWVILFIFSCLTLVVATFVSHTVAAAIILPIVQQVGNSLDDPRPRMLVMAVGLVCSVGMGLPVSGYPNMTASAQANELGVPYLKTKEFLINGLPLSFLAMMVICSIGYGIMTALGL